MPEIAMKQWRILFISGIYGKKKKLDEYVTFSIDQFPIYQFYTLFRKIIQTNTSEHLSYGDYSAIIRYKYMVLGWFIRISKYAPIIVYIK